WDRVDPEDKTREKDFRIAAIQALGEIGKPGAVGAIDYLLESLTQGAEFKLAAIEALGRIAVDKDDKVLAALRLSSTNEDPRIRAATVQALGRLAGSQPALSFADLYPFLNDKEAEVRQCAVEALGLAVATLRNSPVSEQIGRICCFEKDPNTSVRQKVAVALGKVLNAFGELNHDAREDVLRAIDDTLFRLLEDKENQVRDEAALAIGKSGKSQAKGVVQKLLDRLAKERRAELRQVIVRALGQIEEGPTAAADQLVELLGESERDEVRQEAADALKKTAT